MLRETEKTQRGRKEEKEKREANDCFGFRNAGLETDAMRETVPRGGGASW